ncbi:MAG: hypothetical protein EBZ36_01070 [Acidobacteria bacterium]|jgi:hypothetical protein|nr:hypothetical protein [Acidobacteriota bacterium]
MAKSGGDTNKQELVELALAGIDAQIKDLTAKRDELKSLLGSGTPVATKRAAKAKKAKKAKKEKKTKNTAANEAAPGKKKRVFSSATRKKLREAAKARWAREKETKTE